LSQSGGITAHHCVLVERRFRELALADLPRLGQAVDRFTRELDQVHYDALGGNGAPEIEQRLDDALTLVRFIFDYTKLVRRFPGY